MSRVGKQIVEIPAGTDVKLENQVLTVKGSKGTLERKFPENVAINIEGNQITFKPNDDSRTSFALWGTVASHVSNMVAGVNTPYEKTLILEGVGFRTNLEGKTLVMSLGFSHEVRMDVPEGIDMTVEKNTMKISGVDKEKVGQFAAAIRENKKPEPYKGKGIRYEGEYVRRKQGKKTA